MNPGSIGAIILAGAPASAEMDPDGKLSSRAMVEIYGKTMLQYVVDALRGSNTISEIVAIGDVEANGLHKVLAPQGNMVDNINRAIPEVAGGDHVLVVCADIPLLTPDAIDDFVTRAVSLQADLVYPIVEKSCCQGEFDGMKRTYVKTGDGCFTGGNVSLVKRDFYSSHAEIISSAYAARKKPLMLAGLIGYGVLFRFILGQIFPSILKISVLEEAASRLLNARIKALVTNYAEIGEDVDKASDIESVTNILSKRVVALGK